MALEAVSGARIRVPVDPTTAVRLRVQGVPIEGSSSRPVAIISIEADSLLVAEASDRCTPFVDDDTNEIVLDLADCAIRLIDYTPPIHSDVPGPDPFPLWEKPVLRPYLPEPLHMWAYAEEDNEFIDLVCEWVVRLPEASPSGFRALEEEWSWQASKMLHHATERASEALKRATSDERRSVLRRLSWLATLVRHGNSDPEAAEVVNENGDLYYLTDTEMINETYRAVLEACDRLDESEDSRDRSAAVVRELSLFASAHKDKLPPRLALARDASLLSQSLGVARTELLPLAWPGWRYLEPKERVKEVVNPSEEALTALLAARADATENKNWFRGRIELGWLARAECPVLVTQFLGRTIVCEEVPA